MKLIFFKINDMYKNRFLRFQFLLDRSEIKNPKILLMRTVKLFLITIVLITTLWSCEFLDYNELDQYNKDQMLMEFSRVKSLLTNVYSYLPTDFSSVNGAMRASASDDAEHVWEVSDIQKFNDGSWSPLTILDDQWNNMYSGIRIANFFLKETDGLTFDLIKYNVDYPELMKQFAYYPYEARFLRAFYYFELIKRYGSVPLITTLLTQEEADKVTPSPFNTIVDFIVSECDTASKYLPVGYSGLPASETGRATKGAAMALKARTLLYAASPFHNPTPAVNDPKWIAAAKASKELIDLLGSNYLPLEDYSKIVNNLTSKELIFERRQGEDRAFEEANTAIGFEGGNTGTCPTQNLVDAYEMKATGLGIKEAGSGYNATDPYATSGPTARDPRLAMTILYNGALWKSTQTVQTWYGGLNAPPALNATKTGYYLKKYMIESISLNPENPSTAIHVWVLFRYGEILLNYAEAMNEVYGPEGLGSAPLDNLTALQAVNIVRARPGVEMPPFPTGMSQNAFRDKLRNERRVELAFEDHRFWDIRRWKIGPFTTNIRGIDLTRDPVTKEITYTLKVVETRVWDDKMYLYPIPQSELFINNNLEQNPGWF